MNDEVGWCSVPHAGDLRTGSQVFVFFENGDINFPVYFGVAQSGEGWFSEHPNQHCFRSDNIRVRIDENVYDERSTCKFDSYNTYNSNVSKANLKRDCIKNGWKFDEPNGNIKDLETRLDIEIEATKINAVNLNIHGNVNMHIDGDWFVEHFGNYYEYREGDRYLKHRGNTYIEEDGVYRKVLNGPESYEHNGNYTENQVGDKLITQHGKYHDQIDNNVTHVYGENYRMNVKKSSYEMVEHDKDVSVGHNFNIGVINNGTVNVGGFFDLGVDSYLNFDVKENTSIHSREGNILLQTDGQFELMDGPIVTQKGFKNLGTKGNIQFISTFGNINMQCVKNDAIANFNQRSTVLPWNPSFLFKIREAYSNEQFSLTNAMLSGMAFNTDVNNVADFMLLLEEIEQLKIYDGLPVFLPTKMIVQNPNINPPENMDDLSWIPIFRSEPDDWRNVHDDVMWKLPGRLMGNINIETWSGDINIKSDSSIGCAGNINISAKESGGTFTGYKIGTINFDSYGKERVYPDPRDLFLDSDFEMKEAKKYQLFVHGTDLKANPVLHKSSEGLVKGTFKRTFDFTSTNYNKFYDVYGLNAVTYGHPENTDENTMKALEKLKEKGAPVLGCSKCITDYLMGIPGIQEIYYKNEDVIKLKGGKHDFGFQRLNPKDPTNTRGVFNIGSNDFDKISIGDGHAIEVGFMDRSFGTKNIGGFTIRSNGDFDRFIGKNSYTRINYLRKNGRLKDDYIFVEEPYDFNSPECLNKFVEKMSKEYSGSGKGKGNDYVTAGKNVVLAKECVGTHTGSSVDPIGSKGPNSTRTVNANFVVLNVMPKIGWRDDSYYLDHQYSLGTKITRTELLDNRYMIDYGFNFEKSKEHIQSMDPTELIANFYEQEIYSDDYNRWIDHQVTAGGNSRWFQVWKFDDQEHVELSANLNQYEYTFEDMSKNHKKYFKFNDQAFVWWDNEKFNQDLVKWFPDSEFEVKSEKYEQIFGDVKKPDKTESGATFEYKLHKGWAKYGNHVKNDKHPNYNPPTSNCGASYKKAQDQSEVTGKEDPPPKWQEVDTPCELWVHKKGAGVRETRIDIRDALAQDHAFTLNACNCAKNQSIEDKLVWTAETDYSSVNKILAENNNALTGIYKGEINSRQISYEAAINTYLFELNSTHATMVKEDQSPETSYASDTYKLCAGNMLSAVLKGNQDYYNYDVKKEQQDYIVTHAEHANNFEFSQNGFPINKFKILNGTDSAWNNPRPKPTYKPENWPEGINPDNGKYSDNEMIITNGGIGDAAPPTPPEHTGIYPFVSGINNFRISNGKNFQNLAENNISFDNGVGVFEGNNITTIDNGSLLNNGANIVRINNKGLAGADDVENSVTINNDNNNNINLSDKWLSGEPDEPRLKKSIVSLYSSNEIGNYGAGQFVVNFPTMLHRVIKADLNYDLYDLKTNSYELNSKSILVNNNIAVVNSNDLSVLGDQITVEASAIKAQKLVAVGEITGNSKGSFIGCAMDTNGYKYSIDWPIVNSSPTQTSRHAGTFTPTSGIKHTVAPDDIKESVYMTPPTNLTNSKTLEKESLGIIEKMKNFFKSFITFELSLLSSKTIKR